MKFLLILESCFYQNTKIEKHTKLL